MLDTESYSIDRHHASSTDQIYATLATDCLLYRHSKSRNLRDTHTTSLAPQRLCGSLLFVPVCFVGY